MTKHKLHDLMIAAANDANARFIPRGDTNGDNAARIETVLLYPDKPWVLYNNQPSMKSSVLGRIKENATVSIDRSFIVWGDPSKVFHCIWNGSFWTCVADGYGMHKPAGEYGNGSIFVSNYEAIELLVEKNKITRYLWANSKGEVLGRFMQSEEEHKNFTGFSIRLDWSATEFEVKNG